MSTERIHYGSYNSPYDPCPTIIVDWTNLFKLPELYIDFQPYGLPQYAPNVALRHGTLWPTLFSPYHNPYEHPERGKTKVSNKQLPPEFYALMEELQSVDFVLVELTLYLDTHPRDANAVQEFNQFAQKRKELKQKIESIYGPLDQFGHSYVGYPWNWDDPPWPWQL